MYNFAFISPNKNSNAETKSRLQQFYFTILYTFPKYYNPNGLCDVIGELKHVAFVLFQKCDDSPKWLPYVI